MADATTWENRIILPLPPPPQREEPHHRHTEVHPFSSWHLFPLPRCWATVSADDLVYRGPSIRGPTAALSGELMIAKSLTRPQGRRETGLIGPSLRSSEGESSAVFMLLFVQAIKTLRSSSCKTSAEAKLMLAVRASPPAVVHRWLLQIFCVLMESDEALEEVYRLSGEAALSLLGLAQIVDDDRCATKLAAIDHLAPTCMELVRQLGEISTHLATLPFARRKEVLEWRLRKVKLSTGTWLGDDGTWRTLRGLDLPRCFLLSEWSSSTPFHVCLSLEESCSSIEENTGIALVGTSSEGVLYPRSLLSLAAPRRSRKSTMVNTAEHTTERRRMTTSVSKRPSGWTKEVSRSVPSGGVASLVAKAGSMSILQEQLALSMISWMRSCWLECPQGTLERSLGAAVRLYRVLCTSSGGVVEAVPNAVSLDSLKKAYGDTWVSLSAHFEDRWPGEEGEAALDKFCSSMAAYSVICYVLGVRDRHNANILLCDDGEFLHAAVVSFYSSNR